MLCRIKNLCGQPSLIWRELTMRCMTRRQSTSRISIVQLNPRVGSLQYDARNENMSAVASVPLGPCASHIADGYVVRVLFDIPYSASSFVEEVHRGMWLVLLQHHKAVAAEPIGCINRTHPPQRPRFGTICVSSLHICPGTGVII